MRHTGLFSCRTASKRHRNKAEPYMTWTLGYDGADRTGLGRVLNSIQLPIWHLMLNCIRPKEQYRRRSVTPSSDVYTPDCCYTLSYHQTFDPCWLLLALAQIIPCAAKQPPALQAMHTMGWLHKTVKMQASALCIDPHFFTSILSSSSFRRFWKESSCHEGCQVSLCVDHSKEYFTSTTDAKFPPK